MSGWFFGLAITAGLCSLLPSNTEAQWAAPYASIGLAIMAGLLFGIGFAIRQ